MPSPSQSNALTSRLQVLGNHRLAVEVTAVPHPHRPHIHLLLARGFKRRLVAFRRIELAGERRTERDEGQTGDDDNDDDRRVAELLVRHWEEEGVEIGDFRTEQTK